MERLREYITKNYREILLLLSLCLCAVILASIIAQFIGIRYYRLPDLSGRRVKAGETKRESLEEFQSAIRSLFPPPAMAPISAGKDAETTGKGVKKAGSELGRILSDESSRSGLRMVGSIMGGNTRLAMLEFNKKQFVVREKEKIDRFTLSKVGKSWVEFTAGAVTLTVSMKLGKKGSATRLNSGKNSFASTGTIRKTVSKRKLSSLLDLPQKVARDVNFTPVSRNGKPYGIQLTYLRRGSFLEDMGFAAGDIMLSMNNQDLRNPEDALRAIQIMRNEEFFSFRFDRRGLFIQLEITIN